MYRHKVCALTVMGQQLLDHGIAPADFLGSLGLPPATLLAGELWIDRDKSLLLSNRLALATGDPLIGMHVGESQNLGTYGAWSERIFAAGTVGGALQAAIDHIQLIESGRELHLVPDGDRVWLRTWFAGSVGSDPRQFLEASLGVLSRFVRLAAEPVPLQVHLTGRRPPRSDEIERIFGPNLVFGADHAALVFDRQALALPIVPPDWSRQIGMNKPTAAAAAGTAAAVVKWLYAPPECERPTAALVAQSLSLNLRTMQRHLALWGVKFEGLLEDVRLRKALIRLRDPGCSVTDVAFDLGYSDAAHFTRAFRRWTGSTPRQYRNQTAAVRGDILPLLTAGCGMATGQRQSEVGKYRAGKYR
jgi:AraC-like DNA-binding protein